MVVDAGAAHRHRPLTGMWKPAVIALVVVALVAGLLAATAGKDCHFNIHLTKKLYCTERTPAAKDAATLGPVRGGDAAGMASSATPS